MRHRRKWPDKNKFLVPSPPVKNPTRLIDLLLPFSNFLPSQVAFTLSRARGLLSSATPLRSASPHLMLNDSSHPYSRPHFLAPCADSHHPEPPRRMDQPSSSGRGGGGGPTTPRRQLQGPRPPRLNVRMESHAIKKPGGPQAQAPGRREQPGRAPVIIYDASPKVIHAKPSEFMALVQRLTGPGSSAAPPSLIEERRHHQAEHDDDDALLGQPFLPPELLLSPSAAMSPAARLATIERSVRPMPDPPLDYDVAPDGDGTLAAVLGGGGGPARPPPGILSPLPSSLPPAAASGVFSPLPFDASCISWLNELSPILRAAAAAAPPSAPGNTTSSSYARPPPPAYYSDPFVPSPRNNLLATPTIPSPTTCAEFFSLPDF